MPPAPVDARLATRLRAILRAWFAAHGRALQFRVEPDAWGVLVSEVMAQQTQISRVEPAWAAFIERFPTPAALAAASPAAVLRQWAGMGYNRRALNLQAAAAAIEERHGGRVPATVPELEALPGVGPYTARAVAAIAYGVPVAPVDTNVRRVVGRVLVGHGAPGDPGEALPPKELQAAADALVDPADPGGWTHAVMDVGATLCRPAAPRCDVCPLAAWCRRAASGAGAGGTGPTRPRGATADPGMAFPRTRRWLRGRIVARLRELPDGDWTVIDGPIGEHDADAVAASLADLAAEGLIEARPDGAVRLPSTRR